MKSQIEWFLSSARVAYEEAKINYNTGKCTASHLEGVRVALEKLERSAAQLISTHRPEGS